jgi:hypothetical protein
MWWQGKISNHLVNTPPPPHHNNSTQLESNHKCNAGCPVNKFPDGIIPGLAKSNLVSNSSSSTGATDDDVMYSMYAKYEKTFTPTYIQNNLLQLTNPDNYTHLPMGPSNIFIIRHGEKKLDNYADPTNQDTFCNLDCNGIQRSIKLPNFINKLGVDGYPITTIVLTNARMDINISGNASIHAQQTMHFSAWALSIPVLVFGYANCSQPYDATTAINIFTNSSIRGKNIIVAFQHANIQALTNQLVQCYNYFKQGGTVKNLNNSTLYNVSTEEWWKHNTPVEPRHQYSGLKHPMQKPTYPIPHEKYSKYLPYWNANTYDRVYWLSQTNRPNDLTFKLLSQNINTCQNNECNLLIGLIQWQYQLNQNNVYENDPKCLPPE